MSADRVAVSDAVIEKAAVRLAGVAAGDEGQWRGYWNAARAAVQAVAPLILAAELDALAAEMDRRSGRDAVNADDVRTRASVLRGEGDQDGN